MSHARFPGCFLCFYVITALIPFSIFQIWYPASPVPQLVTLGSGISKND